MNVYSLLNSPGKMVARASQVLDRHRRREQEYQERYERFASYAPTTDEVPRAPLFLRIEVVNLCNANCVFCTYQFQTREIETMGFDVFKLAIDQYRKIGGAFISFTPLVGDALIDRELEEKVAYARQFPQFTRLQLWTNAILLTRKRFEALVESGINDFNISFSGFNAAEYEQLYRNPNYARIINNLAEIAQSDAAKKAPIVIWARTGAAEPEKEPDYIKIRDLNTFAVRFQREMFSWHGQIKGSDLPGAMFLMKGPKDQTKPCFHLWGGFTVLSNGDMTVCGCTDLDGVGLPLGNIREVPIDAHLRDGRWLNLRNSFMAGEPPEFCKGCDMYWPIEVRKPDSSSKTAAAGD